MLGRFYVGIVFCLFVRWVVRTIRFFIRIVKFFDLSCLVFKIVVRCVCEYL